MQPPDPSTCVARAAENLRVVEEKLREHQHRVQIQEPTTPRPSRSAAAKQPPAPPGVPTPSGVSMGRAHSANTELAELSTIFLKPK